jgi:DNA-directed RNA polymerase subunit beta'
LKENVIVGHLIPAGTGLREYQGIEVTSKDDLAARQNAAAAEPAAPAKRASRAKRETSVSE